MINIMTYHRTVMSLNTADYLPIAIVEVVGESPCRSMLLKVGKGSKASA